MYEEIKTENPVAQSSARYRISACVGQHIGDRAEQQDRVGIFTSKRASSCVLAVLADGMGGRTGGALAASQVVSTARTLFEDFHPEHDSVENLLTKIVHEAHTIIRLSAITAEKEPHSTLVALVMRPDKAQWAHVGDSRLYYFKGARMAYRTTDHSYVEHLMKLGQIKPSDAKNHKMAHVLTSALGTPKKPTIDFGSASQLDPDDSFMLCSDGLWHYFEPKEMGEILAISAARDASETLISNARQRAQGRGDNCSLAILKLQAPNN